MTTHNISTAATKTYPKITDVNAWLPADLLESQWRAIFTDEQLEELDKAIQKNLDRPLAEISHENTPMRALDAVMPKLVEQVNEGCGFLLLKGFPAAQYSVQECQVAAALINSYFGVPISQNKYGDLMLDVKSQGRKLGEFQVRGYDTDSELRFHNDECDILSLMCLQPAKKGGQSALVSSVSIYNVLRKEYPEHLDTLFGGYIFSLMGEERPGVNPVSDHRIPIYSLHEGKLSCRYTLNTIFQATEVTGIALTTEEKAALDAILEIANRPRMHINFHMEKGDMLFANNLITLHSRTAFEDYDEEDKRRRLLRVWLRSHNPRSLDPKFEERYNGGWSFRKGIPVSV